MRSKAGAWKAEGRALCGGGARVEVDAARLEALRHAHPALFIEPAHGIAEAPPTSEHSALARLVLDFRYPTQQG